MYSRKYLRNYMAYLQKKRKENYTNTDITIRNTYLNLISNELRTSLCTTGTYARTGYICPY